MKAKKLSQSDIGTMKRLLPFIGRRWIALLASLILAAGFKSSAVVSAVVGETVAELVTRDTCAWDLDQYTAAIRPL